MNMKILTIAITCFSCLLLISGFAVADKTDLPAISECVEEEKELPKAEQEVGSKANHTDTNGETPATISSGQHESGDIKSLDPIQLDFRLVGTIIAGEENSYAVIMDETSGKQGMYKSGESINEVTVLKIVKDSIIVEKDGQTQVLSITGGNSSKTMIDDVKPSIGASEGLPHFEPVFSETGPPVTDENEAVKELPHFEPVTNSTGPPVDPEVEYKDLPEFEPIESDSGPPGK